jgi:hypothetical protein
MELTITEYSDGEIIEMDPGKEKNDFIPRNPITGSSKFVWPQCDES